MNSVFLSGLVKGDAVAVPAKVKPGEPAKPDNTLRTVVIMDNKNNPKEFKVFAYAGEMADKLAAIPSGKRVILDGRIGSEILEAGSEIYQGVIAMRRVIAITEAMNGTDVATGTIGGAATCEALRFTQAGAPIANLNIKNTRSFTNKKGETSTTTTYLNAVAWTEKAQQLEPLLPMTDVQVVATGMLVPSEYPSTKHGGAMVSKIEVWVDEFSVGGAAAETPAPRPAPQRAPAKPKTKGSTDGMTEF